MVARVAHRQQVAVFGIEQEQQAVQQDQRRFAHLVEVLARVLAALELAVAHVLLDGVQIAAGQRLGQLRKDLLEHTGAEVLRNLLFVQPSLAERIGMERLIGVVPRLGQKGGAAEELEEQLQAVSRWQFIEFALRPRYVQQRGEVDLEELFGTRAGVLPVQPPDHAVGQQAPLDAAVGDDVDAAQVAQHLRRRRARIERIDGFTAIERTAPAFGLEDRKAVAIAPVVLRFGYRTRLGCRVREQEAIGHVFAMLRRQVHLRQRVICPAQFGQHPFDDQLFGLRLVDRRGRIERRVDGGKRVAETIACVVTQGLPRRRLLNTALEEVLGEKLALHRLVLY